MFDQLKAMKALGSLMGNREEIKAKVEEMQAELARRTVEGDAGSGAVRVVVSGKLEVVGVTLEPAAVAALTGPDAVANKAVLEQLVAAATNDGLRKAQDLAKEEMARLAGGLNLPGLDGLLRG